MVANQLSAKKVRAPRILMLLENEGYPADSRVMLEAESLRDAGYQVTVVCRKDDCRPSSEQVRGIQVYRYPAPLQINGFAGYLLEYAYSMVALFLVAHYVWFRRGFDVVHVHTPPDMVGLIAIYFQCFGKKFVFDHHDLSPELFQAQRDGGGSRFVVSALQFFERIACRRANRLIATNESQRSVQVERCGAKLDDCVVVRNGPNEMFLEYEHDSQQATQTDDRLVIGYVGVIGVQDGVDYLIRALHHLKFELGREDFRAVIVGNGPAMGELKRLTGELELDGQIEFTGMIPFADVPNQISCFDVATTPDPSNAYNDSCTTIKTMEYMALGKPTVCFETAENKYTAGESAVYAQNNDVKEFARAIARLLDAPEERTRLGELAKRRVLDGLTWQHQAQVLVGLYDDLFAVRRVDAKRAPTTRSSRSKAMVCD